MFLERKFSTYSTQHSRRVPALCRVLPDSDWSTFPPLVYDVMVNIQLLLKARRHYDHVLPDYGLSASEGHFVNEELVERLQRQVPQTLSRYEPRFELLELDVDVDDDERSFMTAVGKIRLLPGTFTFAFGCVSRVIRTLTFSPPKGL